MSAASSPGSAASTSGSNARDSASNGRSSSTPTAGPSSPAGSREPVDSPMSGRSAREPCRRSTSSAAASPVRISPSRDEEPGSTAPARVFGRSSPGSFASFDPATSSWRTSPRCSAEKGSAGNGRRSEEFSATWPKWGMTRSGRAFPLESSGRLICASGSGSWPTPHGMPKSGQRCRPGPSGNELGRAVLGAERQKWPTPTVSDARKGLASAPEGRRGRETLSGSVHAAAADAGRPIPGPLSPMWVEWLMGFPIGWTALPPSATPSSRRSPSGSVAGSSNTRGRR